MFGGHLDAKKTLDKICHLFFSPSFFRDIKKILSLFSCVSVGVAPLQPLTIEEEPFLHKMVDVSSLDVATRYLCC